MTWTTLMSGEIETQTQLDTHGSAERKKGVVLVHQGLIFSS